jgi:cation diffusion facilitator CzcD-associated flavoprotein CzcO
MKYIKLNHELAHAQYDEPSGKWNFRIRRGPESNREEIEDTADILLLATGVLSRWKWPDIPGLEDFQGRLVHSAKWDASDDEVNEWADKRVGVIGIVSFLRRLTHSSNCDQAHAPFTGIYGHAARSYITT